MLRWRPLSRICRRYRMQLPLMTMTWVDRKKRTWPNLTDLTCTVRQLVHLFLLVRCVSVCLTFTTSLTYMRLEQWNFGICEKISILQTDNFPNFCSIFIASQIHCRKTNRAALSIQNLGCTDLHFRRPSSCLPFFHLALIRVFRAVFAIEIFLLSPPLQ